MSTAAAPTSPLSDRQGSAANAIRRIKVFSGLAKPAKTPSDAMI